jgi:Holliday junction resolvasome RuvABC endonuclease subunit
MSRILGIDPSLTGCGLALVEDGKYIGSQLISTPAEWQRGQRLAHIANAVRLSIKNWDIVFVAMEGYAFGSPFNREEMGEVGGVIKATLYSMGIEPIIWPNTSWKKAVLGVGNLKKEDLKLPIFQKYGVEIKDMNELEAFCVAMAEHRAQTGEAVRPVVKTKKRGKK